MDQHDVKMSNMGPTGHPPPYSDSGPAHHPPIHHPPQVVGPGATLLIQPGVVGTAVVPVVVGPQVGPKPAAMICKSCNHEIITRVESKSATRTHLFALGLCLVGCWPCVCIPYFMDTCKNADHYCPNCNAYVGSYTH